MVAMEEESEGVGGGLITECRTVLLDVSLQVGVSDRWIWSPERDGRYHVCGVYVILTREISDQDVVSPEFIWHQSIPLKVSLFMWRLSRNRVPTKENLFKWHIVSQDDHFCVSECGHIETATHLFFWTARCLVPYGMMSVIG